MATPKNSNVFYVGIDDTKELKKTLIESMRDSLVFMQKYENIISIREKKKESINTLKKLFKEITKLVSELKTKLPESEIHKKLNNNQVKAEKEMIGDALEKRKSDQKQTEKSDKKNDVIISKSRKKVENSKIENKSPSEMEKLESQLKELENRLKQF